MEPLFAGVVLLMCVLALLRLVIGATRRQRLDAALRRGWFRLRVRALTLWRWRSIHRDAKQAAREAIDRAAGRRAGEWDGNVYQPKAFKKPRKPH
jgi:hypothetical protein